MSDSIIIFDTTLRDGEQAPGAAMTMAEKVKMAHLLARLRVDVIEAGFPISSPAQFEAVQRIADEVEGSTICALARAIEADVKAAGEALAPGRNTRIHTFIATSDIHISAKFDHPRFGGTLAEKRKSILRMTTEAVRYARTFTDNVEFSAEDAGRTDPAFLCEVVNAAVAAGATTINIPDTTGYCVPHEYAALFRTIREKCNPPEHVILSTHCHDDLGLAVANSLAAVLEGARQIECTINGIGERAGNASLEEVVMALKVRADRFDVDTQIETTLLSEASHAVSIATGFAVPPNKAIVGRNAFAHEAGIHQHGVLKSRETYEIMRAEDVGQGSESIRLGRHSGRHGLFSRLDKLGIAIADSEKDDVYQRFVKLADHKKEIYDEDLYYLINTQETPMRTPHYRLDEMHVTTGTGKAPRAEVKIYHYDTGVTHRETASGDGPVDAIYRAIDHATGSHHDLVSYGIRSVTEGADAVGEVTVLIGADGTYFRGVSRHTDVLEASAEAYIEALNQLEAFRSDEHNVSFVGDGIMQSFQGGIA